VKIDDKVDMDSIRQKIETIDKLIREANIKEAIVQFQHFENQKPPREFLLEVSNLARRLNKPFQILKWLHPLVRTEHLISEQATDAEASLYAIGLVRIGAYREAKDILDKLPLNLAEVQLGLIQLNGFQWKYQKMIRPLKRYMKLVPTDSYVYSIAQLNMLTALVDKEDWQACDAHAEHFLNIATEKKYTLLKANALETYAQSKIRQQDFSAATELLNEAGSILRNSGSRYDLFVKKWKLIIDILRSKNECTAEVVNLQIEAQAKSEFETVRELDFYYALARQDQSLFQKVYCGTRFETYRRRMKQKYAQDTAFLKEFAIPFTDNPNFQGAMQNFSSSSLELSVSAEKMLKIVLSDFYRPIQLGEVFRDLYPDEYFNPNTSKDRLYKVFSRLKQELQSQDSPIDII
jgi:hypothetical protein